MERSRPLPQATRMRASLRGNLREIWGGGTAGTAGTGRRGERVSAARGARAAGVRSAGAPVVAALRLKRTRRCRQQARRAVAASTHLGEKVRVVLLHRHLQAWQDAAAQATERLAALAGGATAAGTTSAS